MLLAAILLKLGTYGFIRIAMPILPDAAKTWAPWIGLLAVIGIIYGALCCLAQKDMKRLIAFSSVAHMGYVMLAISTLTAAGVKTIAVLGAAAVVGGGAVEVTQHLPETAKAAEPPALTPTSRSAPVAAPLKLVHKLQIATERSVARRAQISHAALIPAVTAPVVAPLPEADEGDEVAAPSDDVLATGGATAPATLTEDPATEEPATDDAATKPVTTTTPTTTLATEPVTASAGTPAPPVVPTTTAPATAR